MFWELRQYSGDNQTTPIGQHCCKFWMVCLNNTMPTTVRSPLGVVKLETGTPGYGGSRLRFAGIRNPHVSVTGDVYLVSIVSEGEPAYWRSCHVALNGEESI